MVVVAEGWFQVFVGWFIIIMVERTYVRSDSGVFLASGLACPGLHWLAHAPPQDSNHCEFASDEQQTRFSPPRLHLVGPNTTMTIDNHRRRHHREGPFCVH